MVAQPLAGGGRPESRVHPDGELAAGAGAADPADQLVDEPGHAAGGVGPPGPQPGVQHLAAAGPGCQQRVVAEGSGVAVAGTLLGMPVDLHDGGVGVDGHRAVAGSGARRPRAGQRALGELVELAGVAEGEGAQERADRGRRHDPVAQHAGGGPAAQQVGVVDAVATGDHGMHHGQQLGARVGRARPVAEVDELVGGLADPQPFRQGGRAAAAQRWRPRAGRRRRPGGGQGLGWRGMLASKRCPPRHAETVVRQPYSRSSEGPFHARISSPRIPHRWIEA